MNSKFSWFLACLSLTLYPSLYARAEVPKSCAEIQTTLSSGKLNQGLRLAKECAQGIEALLNQRLLEIVPDNVAGYQAKSRRVPQSPTSKESHDLSLLGFAAVTYEKAGLASITMQVEAGAARMTSDIYCNSNFPFKLDSLQLHSRKAFVQSASDKNPTVILCLENAGVVITGRNATSEQLRAFAEGLSGDFITGVEEVAKLP